MFAAGWRHVFNNGGTLGREPVLGSVRGLQRMRSEAEGCASFRGGRVHDPSRAKRAKIRKTQGSRFRRRDFDTSDYHHRTCSLPRLSLEFVADKAIAVTSLSL